MSDRSLPLAMKEADLSRALPPAAREVWTVFRHELKHLFFSARMAVPMIVYSGFGALSVLIFLKIQDFAEKRGLHPTKLGADSEALGKLLQSFKLGGVGTAAEILRDHVPMLMLYFFVLASFFLPILVALVSFDQFSDLSTRGARFALLRVRRETYFAGKSLASLASVAGFLFAMWLVVTVVAVHRASPEDVTIALREGARGWLLMCVQALPYLALTALVSSFAKPGLAFVGTFGLWIVLWLADFFTRWLPEALQAPARAIFPSEHIAPLLSRWSPTLWSGVGALVAIAAVVYVLTALFVRVRDV